MVYQDAIERLHTENPKLAVGLQLPELVFPSDQEIKENGYEGAVDNVYQQIIAVA